MAAIPVSSSPATPIDSPIPMSAGPSEPQGQAAVSVAPDPAVQVATGNFQNPTVASVTMAAPSINQSAASSGAIAPAPAPVSSSTTIADQQPQQQQLAQIYATVAASLAAHGNPPFILVPTSLFAAASATGATSALAAVAVNAFQFPAAHALSTLQQTNVLTTAAIPSSAKIGLDSSSHDEGSRPATFGLAPVNTTNSANSSADLPSRSDTLNTPPGSPALAAALASPAAAISVPRRHPRPDDTDSTSPALPPTMTPPKPKRQRTRKTYSFTEKAAALDQLAAIRGADPAISVERAARTVRINGLPIPDSTLHSWIADESAIRKAASEASKSTVRRCAGTILGPLLEEAIAAWARREVEAAAAKQVGGAAHPVACPGLKIQQCARMVARKKADKLKTLGKPVSALLEAFCGSDGWLDRFKARWGIKLNGAGAAAVTAVVGGGQPALATAAGSGQLADVCGGDASVWTEEKWDAVIDCIIAIECPGTNAESSVAAPAAGPDVAATNAAGESEQPVPPVTCVMPTSSLSVSSSISMPHSDSDSAGEDALSFLLNYPGSELVTTSIADICDCGTVSAAAAAAASFTGPAGLPMAPFATQQPLGPLAGLEELSLMPPALATFSPPPAMSSFSWFSGDRSEVTLPPSAAAASSSASTMTPIPLQQLLSFSLVPNESASTLAAASSALAIHDLPQPQQQQKQQPAAYASSSPSYSPPTSPASSLGPQLYSSLPSSPSGAYSAVNTFHDLHAHFVGTREWDVSVLAAAKEILVRNGEWASGREEADMLLGAVRGV